MIHDPIPHDPQPMLPLFDQEALDIADYLKSEHCVLSDLHTDETRKQGTGCGTGATGWRSDPPGAFARPLPQMFPRDEGIHTLR
jgi:hypothetical protein